MLSTSRSPISPPIARVAISSEDRWAAARLRYDVYIAEQGKPYPEADHTKRLLGDELDVEATIVLVEQDNRLLGTVRANSMASPSAIAKYGALFDLHEFHRVPPATVVVCSRLAVAPEHRHSTVRNVLFEQIYEEELARGTRFCFATCAPALVRIFRRFGFREYAPPVDDVIAGRLHRTILVLDDLAHLEKTSSSFLSIAAKHQVRATERSWLAAMLDAYQFSGQQS